MRRIIQRKLWPLAGILISICLFVAATAFYPGGTSQSATSVGYDWQRNFISSLFGATAWNGAPNTARYFAIPAMFIFCLSIAIVFKHIGGRTTSRLQKQAIEIGGIGSMVYAFLVVTPMHDLMIDIALLFFAAALLGLLHLLYVRRSWPLFLAGMVCVVILLAGCAMYYGNVLYGLLPITQKLTFAVFVLWLLLVDFSIYRPGSTH